MTNAAMNGGTALMRPTILGVAKGNASFTNVG